MLSNKYSLAYVGACGGVQTQLVSLQQEDCDCKIVFVYVLLVNVIMFF